MSAELEQQAINRVFWRLVPFAMILFVVAYVDRVNVGFAALQMNQDLKFSPAVYGLGAGIFFLGYALFEVPSNLILARTGARTWIARIMITWGIIAVAMAYVSGENSFYVLRFLLGVAEAGFLPGLIYYFSNWIPRRQRAKILGVFLSGTAVASIVGGPLSGGLLALDGLFGLRGWQIMFIAEGVPAVLLGLFCFVYLTERPQDATWLKPEEKQALLEALGREDAELAGRRSATFTEVICSGTLWKLIGFCFFMICANYGVVLWLPQILKAFGNISNVQVGFLSALPFVIAAVCMIYWGRHSDRVGERKWHLTAAVCLGGAGLAASALAPTALLQLVCLCIAAVGLWSTFGVFWAMPNDYLKGAAAAGGLAFINSVGICGGFVGPYVVGFVRSYSSSFSVPLLVLAFCAFVAALFAVSLPRESAVTVVRPQPAE